MAFRNTIRPTTVLQRERRLLEFGEFLRDLIKELNDLSTQGAAVLVEGKRDANALRELGYAGPLFTITIMTSSMASRQRIRQEVRQMIILTDLDTEGQRLAARFIKFLSNEGIKPSLAQRKRLSAASRGVFLHVENLRRFALGDEGLPDAG